MIRSSMHNSVLTRASLRRASRLSVLAIALCASAAGTSFAAELRSGSGVTVTPGGRAVVGGLRTAVVSATDTSGDVKAANAALLAANVALGRAVGFNAVPASEVASALSRITVNDQMEAKDFMAVGKSTKAARALVVSVTPGDASDASASYRAVAELFDTATGGLVGRGDGVFTATADSVTADAPTPAPANTGSLADVLRNRALSGAIYQAVNELNRPASFRGIVVSMSGPYQARISLGERAGVRNGARIEYLREGAVVGFGSVFDVGNGESVATIAPEAAAPLINVNTDVLVVSNPSAARAGKTSREIDDAEFKKFERDFGISAAIAGIAYYVWAVRD